MSVETAVKMMEEHIGEIDETIRTLNNENAGQKELITQYKIQIMTRTASLTELEALRSKLFDKVERLKRNNS